MSLPLPRTEALPVKAKYTDASPLGLFGEDGGAAVRARAAGAARPRDLGDRLDGRHSPWVLNLRSQAIIPRLTRPGAEYALAL